MRFLALVLAVSGCGGTAAVCEQDEVRCGDARCILKCDLGEWVEMRCLPSCGESMVAAGANFTTCRLDAVMCVAP